MAPVKTDKRRADLIVPYEHVPMNSSEPSSMFSSTLPLAAMFMRNKLLAWAAVFTAIQSFLNEPINKKAGDSQPAWITLMTALIGLLTCYMDFVMPNMRPTVRAPKTAAETTA
ncbi:hypothetical protein TRVA0_001S02498 [Trichomonascus vanleenenianus]|uniref:uncharacterized protein n=1 Tax=Trichomonascus vanleenenianus TaxID=2268995 RepID=UPI003ECB9A06